VKENKKTVREKESRKRVLFFVIFREFLDLHFGAKFLPPKFLFAVKLKAEFYETFYFKLLQTI